MEVKGHGPLPLPFVLSKLWLLGSGLSPPVSLLLGMGYPSASHSHHSGPWQLQPHLRPACLKHYAQVVRRCRAWPRTHRHSTPRSPWEVISREEWLSTFPFLSTWITAWSPFVSVLAIILGGGEKDTVQINTDELHIQKGKVHINSQRFSLCIYSFHEWMCIFMEQSFIRTFHTSVLRSPNFYKSIGTHHFWSHNFFWPQKRTPTSLRGLMGTMSLKALWELKVLYKYRIWLVLTRDFCIVQPEERWRDKWSLWGPFQFSLDRRELFC